MADRPIIFSAPMVRALLAGRKTQTRRLLNPQPETFMVGDAECEVVALHVDGEAVPRVATGRVLTGQKLRYAKDDRLYVRENWRVSPEAGEAWHPDEMRGWIDYQAGGSLEVVAPSIDAVESAAFLKGEDHDWDFLPSRYRPCIHMPRWASRLTLIAEGVRVEPLQAISEADAIAEGCPRGLGLNRPDPEGDWQVCAVNYYHTLWDTLHRAEGERWAANPDVLVLTFRVERANIDRLAA